MSIAVQLMSRVPEIYQDDSLFIIERAKFLTSRLEHLSADSVWAHQASGIRGSILRCLEQIETSGAIEINATPGLIARLNHLVDTGYSILIKAAKEIPATK